MSSHATNLDLCIIIIISFIRIFYSVNKKIHLRFSGIFPKRLGIFSPYSTRLLHVPIYAGLQIFIQLSPTVTKLPVCHIECNYPACVLADGGHFEHIMVVALNMA